MSISSNHSGATAALKEWAGRRHILEEQRAPLLRDAWNAGEQNVTELARLAGVSRTTVYNDLRMHGIYPANKYPDAETARLIRALTSLAKAFDIRSQLHWETKAVYGPLIAGIASVHQGFTPAELGELAKSVLDVEPFAEDEPALHPLLTEIEAALVAYPAGAADRADE